MEYFFAIIFAFILTLVEPVLFFPFGISTFLIIWGVISLKIYSQPQVIFLVLSSIFLDITLKYTLGSHLVSALLLTLLLSLSNGVLPDSGNFIKFLKLSVIAFVSLVILGSLKSFEIDMSDWSAITFFSLITSIIILTIQSFVSMFKSDSNMSKLVIK